MTDHAAARHMLIKRERERERKRGGERERERERAREKERAIVSWVGKGG